MLESELTTAFIKEERELFINRARIALLWVAAPLVVGFNLIDRIYCPQFADEFLVLRLLIIPACLLAVFLYRFAMFRGRLYQLPTYPPLIFLGGYIAYMIERTGVFSSPYYAGLNLIALVLFPLFPATPLQVVGCAAAIYGPYLVVTLGGPSAIDWPSLTPNLAFCASTFFTGLVISLLMRRVRLAEFAARLKLYEEISSKERIIAEKTEQGVYLEKLACQFSPQVIEAVRDGRLEIGSKQRLEVTSIFIDLANSTKRSINLDAYDYLEILLDFFKHATRLLQDNGVTVCSFLGDGLMAFTNAPLAQPTHRLIALRAAEAVLQMHESKRRYYSRKWRGEFAIRVGINSGFAHVGFFPDREHGTYTAIGPAVNLAARLCAGAPTNAILVTGNFIKSVGESLSDIDVARFQPTEPLKGFDSEQIDLYSVHPQLGKSSISHRTACVLCGNLMADGNDLGDTVVLKCVHCGYTDIVEHQVINIQTGPQKRLRAG